MQPRDGKNILIHTLLIHQSFTLPSEPGGSRHFELARYLVQRGHRFTVVASDLNYQTGQRANENTAFVKDQEIEGVRVLRAATYPTLHRSFVWRVVAFLSFMVTSVRTAWRAGPADLVIGTSPPIFQTLSAWLVSRLRRCPFLLEIRDLWPAFAIDMGVLTNPLLIAMSRWLERFLYAQAAHIVVNSPAYRTYLIDQGIAETKISLIPNGVDPEIFNVLTERGKMRDEWAIDQDAFVVTYTGALGPANDIDTVLQAASYLTHDKAIYFLLVGDGKARPQLEQRANSLGLRNVKFLGTRPKTDIPEILNASDACLATLKDIPMFRTTYPNKVFDYMAAGRPTILAIDGVIREVVEAAGGGLYVPPGNARALAEAIRRLAQDCDSAQAMGMAARTYVTEHFNRQQHAVQFAALSERVGQRRPRQ